MCDPANGTLCSCFFSCAPACERAAGALRRPCVSQVPSGVLAYRRCPQASLRAAGALRRPCVSQ
eukprot:359547-Chlamydomonas_euryale.AAC.6